MFEWEKMYLKFSYWWLRENEMQWVSYVSFFISFFFRGICERKNLERKNIF